MLEKPKFGSPCNGCGYCCAADPCALAQEFLACVDGPCVALEYHHDIARCGLVRDPLGYIWKAAHPDAEAPTTSETMLAGKSCGDLSAQIAKALGIGRGCDADSPA